MKAHEATGRRIGYAYALLFAFLAVGIVAAGVIYYRNYAQRFRADIEDDLSVIAELKVDELRQYRKERLADANVLFRNADFAALVRRFLEQPADADAQNRLRTWLDKYEDHYQYDRVLLLDVRGNQRLASSGAAEPVCAVISQQAAEVIRMGEVVFQDFFRSEYDQRVYLAVLVPIDDGAPAGRPLGVLVLRIDPRTYLYPLIKRWPTLSRTAETLLVRREGANVLFLNELKFQSDTALTLRFPLERTEVPAVQAVLGQKGIVEGRDYRDVPVIAEVRAIPDSPWLIVARIDIAEAEEPLRERLWLTLLFVSVVLASVGGGIGVLWRQQRVRFYRERAQVAEALRESEERFRRVFEEGPIGMVMLDETFRFIRVNPVFAAMLGYSVEELRTMSFPDITHPDYVKNDVEQVRRLWRGELAVYRTEKRYLAKSGVELWGQVHATVVRNADGSFRYSLAIVSDITERKRAEMEAVRAAREWQTTFDATNDAIWILDRDHRVLRSNKTAERIFHRPCSEMLGQPCWTIVHGTAEPHQDCPYLRARQSGQRESMELQIEERWHEITVDPVLDTVGQYAGAIHIVSDITARKEAEAALRASEAHLRLAQVAAKAGSWEWDLQANTNIWSEELWQLYGLAPHSCEPSYEAWRQTIHPDDRAQAEQAVQAATQLGTELNAEWRVRDPDGTLRWLMSRGQPVHDGAGRVARYIGIVLDITARKQAEAAVWENEARLRLALEATNQGLYDLNLQTGRAIVSPEYARMIGYEPGEVAFSADWWREHLHPDNEENTFRTLEECAHGQRAEYRLEYRLKTKSGDWKWILSLGKVVELDPQGRPLRMLGTHTDITERKQAEVEMQKLAAVVMHSSELVNLATLDGQMVFLNEAGSKMLGIAPEAMAETNIMQVIPEHLLGRVRHELLPKLIEGSPWEGDLQYRNLKTGALTDVHVMAFPIKDPQTGMPHLLANVSLDITAQKRAEAALQESENKFKGVFELSSVGKSITRLSGEVQANQAFCDLLGYSPEELRQKSWQEITHPDDVAPTHLVLEPLLVGKQDSARFIKRYLHKNGSVVWADVSTTLRRDEAGQPLYFMTAVIDITERKRAEAALRENEALLTAQFANSPDLILIVDRAFKITSINKVPAGPHTTEELRGRDCIAILPPEFREEARRRVEACFRNGEIQEFEHCISHERWVMARLVRIGDGSESDRVMIISTDITERRRAEEALQHTTRELQRQNTELERFTYTVSHDLKSPLVTIQTFASYLVGDIQKQDSERIGKDLNFIRGAADKMTRLLKELLDLSRVGRKMNPFVEMTLQAVVQEALALVAGRIAQRGVEVSVTEEPVLLHGDRLRLVEVFQNLVDNAVKFMGDQPAPRVEIGVETTAEGRVFFVRDNGGGIDPRHRGKLFGLFEKLEPRSDGTGIGLALIKRIVEVHGGRVWLESEGLGKGTTVRFTLGGPGHPSPKTPPQ